MITPVKSNYKTILVCGLKQVGKTNETLKSLVFEYLKKLRKKGLIYDPNREQLARYRIDGLLPDGTPNPNATEITIPRLPHDKVYEFSCQREVEIRRVTPFDNNGRELPEKAQVELLVHCLSNFYGGALFIDDLNFTLGDHLPQSFVRYLTNNSHRNSDIILQVQDIGRILPKILQNTNMFRIHHMNGGCVPAKEKLDQNYEICRLTEMIVERQYRSGNTRYFLYADIDNQKIKGNFTGEMLLQAICDYVDYGEYEPMKMYEKFKDDNGKKKYNYQTARQLAKSELFRKYFPAKI